MQSWLIENILESRFYKFYVIDFTIVLRILSAFWEPVSPDKLKSNGLNTYSICIVSLFIVIEWIDVYIRAFIRYERFRLRTHKNSLYLSECKRIEFGSS